MNEKTKNALISLLNEEVTVASWGITNLAIKDTCFEFCVSGLLYQGKVIVAVQDSDCLVNLENGEMVKCNISNLVQCLDHMIEKTSDYEAKVVEWIKFYNSTFTQD